MRYHGRYHTIGEVDLRAVSTDMLPLRSGGCRSTDSEAMNIVEIMRDVQEICGNSVRLYSGDSHTVSRIAAGMAFLSFGLIAAGRIHYKPKKPLSKGRITDLRLNDLGQTVENANFLKRKARIVESGVTRMDKNESGLLLLSGELVLSIVYLYHLLKDRTALVSPLNFADICLIIPA
jgi:hypothetical protein